jgi:flagellar biosynthetic protein FliQ
MQGDTLLTFDDKQQQRRKPGTRPLTFVWHQPCIHPRMSPELALTELRGGLVATLWIAGPLLLTVLVVGVVVGIIQAATQLNEPTIAFVAKAGALTAALFALGSLLLGHLVEFTILLFQRIPHLIG